MIDLDEFIEQRIVHFARLNYHYNKELSSIRKNTNESKRIGQIRELIGIILKDLLIIQKEVKE